MVMVVHKLVVGRSFFHPRIDVGDVGRHNGGGAGKGNDVVSFLVFFFS